MDFDRYAADYGTLSSSYFGIGRITNASELLRGEELYRLLRLCGIPEKENGARASDWELFRSLCRAYPLLTGHPIRTQISDFLKTHFSVFEPLNEESCARIWHTTVLDLEQRPRNAVDFLGGREVAWLCDTLEMPSSLPDFVKPVLLGNLLLEKRDVTLKQWQNSVRNTVKVYADAGCDRIVLRVGRDFSFSSPSVYQVDRILQKRKLAGEERDLLLTQLLRELCVLCLEKGMTLVLELQCDPAPAEQLLAYVGHTVGLPKTYVSASCLQTADRLIDLMGAHRQNPMRLAIRLGNFPSDEEVEALCRRICTRYPVGRLLVITAADLRRIFGVRDRFDENFRKMF